MAQILNGREIAKRIRDKVQEMVKALPTPPGMAAILVGDDPASHLYVNLKERACQEAGIRFEKLLFPADSTESQLIETIKAQNARPEINGILVQLPLPNQDPDRVVGAIDPEKDIDGFHPQSLLVPPVSLGIMKLIDAATTARHQVTGSQSLGDKAVTRRATIISSPIFARPLIALLKEQGVSITNNTKDADILIVAIGKPESIKGEQVKPGAIVIDVGTTRVGQELKGDVERKSVAPVAGALTPVPGGVGPVTVAMLILNVVKAYRRQRAR